MNNWLNLFLFLKFFLKGWQKFIRRRNAVHKINSFPEATEQQLRDFDDVCAICYQELSSARITRCKHYFHGVCLRKWLYVQDICPLCHEELCVESENNSTNKSTNNRNVPAQNNVLPENGQQSNENNTSRHEENSLNETSSDDGDESENTDNTSTVQNSPSSNHLD